VDKADLARTRVFELPAFSFFHLGDGWEEADGTIRFDVAANRDASFAIEGARVLVAQRGAVPGVPSVLKLITLRPDGRVEMVSAGVTAEFPKSDPRRPCAPRRLTVHTTGDTGDRPLPNGLAVQDWSTGDNRTFVFEDTQIMEEAVFVPKPGRTDEADAWLVAPSINLAEGVTELHVFDVAAVEAGPVATWRADVALPAGFHGAWRG
jgi:carotenoid cleavage dioxygenase-like enzyme